jgi:hypothetical protein
MSVNSSFTLAAVLADVSRKNNPFSATHMASKYLREGA